MKKTNTKYLLFGLVGLVVGGAIVALTQSSGQLFQGALIAPIPTTAIQPTTTATTTLTTTALYSAKLTNLETYAKNAYKSLYATNQNLCNETAACPTYMNANITKYASFNPASTVEARLAFLEQFKTDTIITMMRQYAYYGHYNRTIKNTWDETVYYKSLRDDLFGLNKYLQPTLTASTDLNGRIAALEKFKTESAASIKNNSNTICLVRFGLGSSQYSTCIKNIQDPLATY